MSDFFSGIWGYYITAVALGGIIYCLILLFSQRAWLGKTVEEAENTGHVWDGDLTELNNPVPRWWTMMYLGLCVFGLAYLLLYPGLGSWGGLLGYSTAQSVRDEQIAMQEKIQPVYARFSEMEFEELAADPEAQEIGQRLFLNNCAQCHGSDAKGGPSFPNLTDDDWLHGGEPEQIIETVSNGRIGIMPPWGSQVTPAEASDIAQYVRSLSGLAADPLRIGPGQRLFAQFCVACHGVDGTGNTALGAPNLTDDVWLHGSSEKTIVNIILNGIENEMPAQSRILTPEQINLVSAWVWGLSNQPGSESKSN